LLGGPNLSAIIKKADELRNAGHVVEMDVESHSRAELQAKMEGRENCTLIYLEDQQV
jgi:ATP phosphoribosyltransferase regulatory subunit